jgi:glycosyltransferase involved in cell wall biosynthesis
MYEKKTPVKNTGSRKVCLLTDHHICMNPRLWKEAFLYEKLGWEVVILTMWQNKSSLLKDRAILSRHSICYDAYLNLIPGQIGWFSRLLYRARKRIAGDLQRFFKLGTGWAISHAPERMFSRALAENADLYSAHLECAFYTGRKLVKAGKKVSFDFEDWYSHDYLVPGRPVSLLEKLEKFALKNGAFCTAASGAMAEALQEYYHIKTPVTVVYNGFPAAEVPLAVKPIELGDATHVPLLWFSRTIGPHRGIEFLLKALEIAELKIALHLLGEMAPGYQSFLEKAFPYGKGHRLTLHGFKPHDQLLPFIAGFKIGLAIEENINANRRLTITNKILQYLQAGLMVIASDTPGQQEVARYFPSSVQLVDISCPGEIVAAIRSLQDKEQVNPQDNFHQHFSWEAQELKLKDLIERHS